MKKHLRIISTGILLLIILLSGNSFSQTQRNLNFKSNKKVQTEKEQQIEIEINSAREQGDKAKMLELQSKLDELTPNISNPGEPYPGNFVHVSEDNNPVNPLTADVTEISSLNGVRALATATEQRGANVGRIWVAIAISNSTARDSIYYYRSDNNGTSWTLYGFISLSNSDEVSFDEMDLEIIEDNTGDKYLWTVYGLTASNDKKFIGYCTLRTPNFSAGLGTITWPGENTSNLNFGTFRPRITSDNSRYSNTAHIYICTSYDTTHSGMHDSYIRFAKCNNPYTSSPVFTINEGDQRSSISSDLHTDIAFNNNGGDSLVSIISGIGKDLIFEHRSINFALRTYRYDSAETSFNKEYVRAAASGGTNQPTIAVVYKENYQNSGDWDIKSLYSNNGGSTFSVVNVDVSRDDISVPSAPDIISRRNVSSKFYTSYTIVGPSYDEVKYTHIGTGLFVNWTTPVTMNHVSGAFRPKPAIKYSGSDSCLCIWAGGGGNNTWASNGCTGFNDGELNLTALIQGFYNSVTNTMVADTVNVILRNTTSPYSRVDSSEVKLNSSGVGVFSFGNITFGTNYYIVIHHRNSIETWSSGGNSFTAGNMSYSFITASNKAFGNNQIQVNASPLRFAIYSGDVNQDGTIDLTDIINIYNDAGNLVSGYVNTDVTGDNFVDLTDLLIAYNNSINFVSLIRP